MDGVSGGTFRSEISLSGRPELGCTIKQEAKAQRELAHALAGLILTSLSTDPTQAFYDRMIWLSLDNAGLCCALVARYSAHCSPGPRSRNLEALKKVQLWHYHKGNKLNLISRHDDCDWTTRKRTSVHQTIRGYDVHVSPNAPCGERVRC